MRIRRGWALALACGLAGVSGTGNEPKARAAGDWVELECRPDGPAWKQPTGAWYTAGDARLDEKDTRRLTGTPGTGTIVNGPTGRTSNLWTRESYGDVAFECEFMVPNGSNSGVKFEGLYEVQIFDSHKVGKPSGSDCGGIYPRAELLPRYHHIDEGHAPRVNACLAPGQWQKLEVVFLTPRFGEDGKKTENARIAVARLNGQVIHEGLDLQTPTGHAYTRKEPTTGPIMLQADHGPVAFRNVRVRSIEGQEGEAFRKREAAKAAP